MLRCPWEITPFQKISDLADRPFSSTQHNLKASPGSSTLSESMILHCWRRDSRFSRARATTAVVHADTSGVSLIGLDQVFCPQQLSGSRQIPTTSPQILFKDPAGLLAKRFQFFVLILPIIIILHHLTTSKTGPML